MKKKLLAIGLSLLMIISTYVPVNAVDISAQYAIVIDQESGQILYDKNAKERMYPASITKILTCIVAIEMIDDLEEKVTITQSDIDTVWETGASAANFEVGEVVTYRDILMGAMLPSGADACRALANNTCGSQEKFVAKMNDKAKELGLNDTHFVNTTGIYDDNHYTTVYDMAVISQYACKNEKFVEIFNRYQYNASNGLHQWIKKVLYNCKKDHMDVSMIEGCKSGYTMKSQHTLSSVINVDNHRYVCVVGFCQNSDGYNHCSVNDTLTLGRYIASKYKSVNLLAKDTKMNSVDVNDGEENNVDVVIAKDVNVVLPNGYNQGDIEYKYHLKTLTAPVKKGAKAGTMDVLYQGDKVGTVDLKTKTSVEENGFIVFMRKLKAIVIPCFIIIVLAFVILLIVRKVVIYQRRKRRRNKRSNR